MDEFRLKQIPAATTGMLIRRPRGGRVRGLRRARHHNEVLVHIVVEWAGYRALTTVEWTFAPLPDGTTFVSITNVGFEGDGDEVVKQALDSIQGFALVLAGLKALLEDDVRLNLVVDRFPKGIENH